MPATNYCIYSTNIWCIPTTEIATWWQVVIAAVAVIFAIRAIQATNKTSRSVLERDQRILDAKRSAVLAPLLNECYAVLVRTFQIKLLLQNNHSKDAYDQILTTFSLMEAPCIERCVLVIEAFKKDEATQLTRCSLTISKCHNYIKGNPREKLEDDEERATLTSSFNGMVDDLERNFSEGMKIFSKASGIPGTPEDAAKFAQEHPLLLPRKTVKNPQREASTPPVQPPPAGPSPAETRAQPSPGTAAPKPAVGPSAAATAAPAPSAPPSAAPNRSSSPEARKQD